jgi:hypothetical protein
MQRAAFPVAATAMCDDNIAEPTALSSTWPHRDRRKGCGTENQIR